ncbi:MAG TPA: iron-sulfur cluster repair di-iron protein [Vicinamibacterales bacterium]|nr:iron-sulfur cluster repair di-iron protein [Vicinamibacterales bacterium]
MTNSPALLPLAARSLSDLVKHDARAAIVLERFGLDYCCGGQQTLEEATAAREIPVAPVIDALDALGDPPEGAQVEEKWAELDALTGHIVERHHEYVRRVTPTIEAWLDKLATRHGGRHPELLRVRETFGQLSSELTTHMAKEENLLFPFIDELAAARRTRTPLPISAFGTVLHPVRVMEADHRAAGDLLARLRALTGGYAVPDDACTTYRLCYAELERYEADLHRHVHLENHVLFPQALELERELT